MVMKEKNVEVVEVGEGEEVDPEVVAETKKIRKDIHIIGRTMSSNPKSSSTAGI